jgi:hypothetical protein
MVMPRLAAQDVFHFVDKTTVVRYADIAGKPGTTDLAPFACPGPHQCKASFGRQPAQATFSRERIILYPASNDDIEAVRKGEKKSLFGEGLITSMPLTSRAISGFSA